VPGSLIGGCGEEFCSDNVFVRDRKKGRTELISVPYSGSNDLPSIGPVITPDGRFVAFISAASNLVQGDTSGGCRPEGAGCDWDVFVRDREHGTTERVSISTKGAQANESSFLAGISGDGRLVAFESDATNLVPGDSNGTTDVFVRDRKNGTTERVSVGPNGKQANAGSHGGFVSADGRYVVFSSDATNLVPGDTNGHADIFVRDLKLGTTRRVSLAPDEAQADGDSYSPALSPDGRLVTFESDATNLVPGDTNGVTDVFVRAR
jgi:Tol biopolymer transport system component